MLAGQFQRKLRALNPELRIWCGDSPNTPAGLFIIQGGEYVQICGVDKQWVGEHQVWRQDGQMARRGWRSVVRLLIQQKLVDRRAAERAFNAHFPYAPLSLKMRANTKIGKRLLERFRVD